MKLLVVAVGQRMPDWAQTAWDDYAKRFPPELKLELRAVKTEPRGSKTLETLYAAERERIEGAIARGMRIVALDERGTALTTKALAQRLQTWQGEGDDVALVIGGPRRPRPRVQSRSARAHPPVRPHAAPRHGARAAGRAALPRLVRQCRSPVPSGMTSTDPFIYLASQSPRRAQLLGQLGVRHALLLADAHEDAESLEAVLPNEAPASYVQRVTALKLDAAVARLKRRGLADAPVLCADTTVALGRTILGKPEDVQDARRMLGLLSGATHRVLTAVALQHGAARHAALSVSRVRFAVMSPEQIARYADSGEPLGKAGAYAIQGAAAAFVEHISGSYSGIMGLPMFETAQLLRGAGFNT